jgi:hypothetical protein
MLKALSAPAYRTTLGAVRGFASRIAELPPAQIADAIASAERYFRTVLRQFGYTDDDCNRWTSMIMRTLRQMVLGELTHVCLTATYPNASSGTTTLQT